MLRLLRPAQARILKLAVLGLFSAVGAWNPPDTAEILREFQPTKREKGLPVLLAKPKTASDKEGLALALSWRQGAIVQARYEKSQPWEQGDFEDLAMHYGGGGTWHPLPDALPSSPENKLYPGLIQQWRLEGYGGQSAWAGTGVYHHLFFLVFNRDLPKPIEVKPTAPISSLSLRPDARACQDTLGGWLKIPCPSGWAGLADLDQSAQCFSPVDDAQRFIAYGPMSPGKSSQAPGAMGPTLSAWWRKGDPLQDIAMAMRQLPPRSEAAYAEDMSKIFFGEAKIFLAQLAASNSCAFNLPSWSFSRLQTGAIPPEDYQPHLGKRGKSLEWLPALNLVTPACSLKVDIALGGAYRMQAFSKAKASLHKP